MEHSLKHLIWLACAGLSGSFVGWRFFRPKKKATLADSASYLVSGLLVAFFLTPFVCKWFHVTELEDMRTVAFFTGVFWSKILDKYAEDFKNGKLPGGTGK